jgi:peptidoglycan/LPS O-acetylase OafA/YrhL
MKKMNHLIKNSTPISAFLAILGIACIFYGFFINHTVLSAGEIPIVSSAFHYIFNKTIFIFGIGVILHLTYLGKLGLLRDVLSLKLFTVFGRVTFGVYLIHMLLMFVYYFGFPSNIYFRFTDMLFLGFGFLSITIIISLLVTSLVESPVVNMLKGSNKKK